MRGLGKRLPIPSPLLPSSSLLPYSTFSGGGGDGGGDGGGRGRGRGLGVPPPPPSSDDHDPTSVPSLGHGRGRGATPSSGGSILPYFPSFVASSPSLGRGRGQPQPPPPPENPNSKKPIFFTRDKAQFSDPDDGTNKALGSGSHQRLPSLPGAGRGKAPAPPAPKPAETNRHARPRQPIGAKPSAGPTEGPRLSQEEAVKKAVEVLMRGGTGGGRGRGSGVRGRGGGRGRGGWRGGRGRGDADDELELYVGENADGEKFVKKMGEERMKVIEEAFEEMSSRVLPSPVEDAYLDALHTNNLIEYEPEYLMEFDRNPDIDDTPPMSLEEVLQKAKPFLMAYEGIKSQEEWEEIIKELMERLPHMKELMDMYCGPDRVTAKQQMQELDRVAKTLPENIPSSVKRFTDRAVLSLQSNPGWGWDKKCQFMDKVVMEVSKHYK